MHFIVTMNALWNWKATSNYVFLVGHLNFMQCFPGHQWIRISWTPCIADLCATFAAHCKSVKATVCITGVVGQYPSLMLRSSAIIRREIGAPGHDNWCIPAMWSGALVLLWPAVHCFPAEMWSPLVLRKAFDHFVAEQSSVLVQCCIVLLLARALNVLVSSLYLPPFVQPLSNKVGSVVSFMIVQHKLFAQTWRWRVASRAGVSNAVWRRAKRPLIRIGLSRLSHGATGQNVQQSITAAIAGSTRWGRGALLILCSRRSWQHSLHLEDVSEVWGLRSVVKLSCPDMREGISGKACWAVSSRG